MKITLEIDDKDVALALQTAAESGVGYWAHMLDWSIPHDVQGEPDELIADVTLRDDAGPRIPLDIERGLRMMLVRAPGKYASRPAAGRGDNPSAWDANQADAFVQYAAFGELRYG